MSLEQLWKVHVAPDPHLLGRLLARHRERHRRYHTVDHLTAVVNTVVDLAHTSATDRGDGPAERANPRHRDPRDRDPRDREPDDRDLGTRHPEHREPNDIVDLGAVVAAAFYHDAVYEPASTANERASARLARRDLGELGWEPARAGHVADLIEATAHHVDAPDLDHALLFDADLAILGADPQTYDTYVRAVRAEYHHVDDQAWQRGRTAVLEAFLDRTTIYSTVAGRSRWERSARANIAGELGTLRA